jgi:hypothetical protein
MPDRRLLALLPALLAWAGVADACRCAPVTAASAYADADAVVLARVAARRDTPARRTYRLIVGESWERALSGPVTVGLDRDTCMPDLVGGKRYLLYLNGSPATGYETSICSGNLDAERAGRRIADLRRGRRTRPRPAD